MKFFIYLDGKTCPEKTTKTIKTALSREMCFVSGFIACSPIVAPKLLQRHLDNKYTNENGIRYNLRISTRIFSA